MLGGQAALEIFTGLQTLNIAPSAASLPHPPYASPFPAELAEPQGSRSYRQVLEHLPSS